MLTSLLRKYLAPYRRALAAVVALQFVQVMATLYLPTLNADIIDKGVVRGDTGFIWTTGSVMLAITLVQVAFAVAAIYYASRAAMGFGRDVRGALFHQVTDFSVREVGYFGASSLITRITNDVQQVQMLVVMGCTVLVAAPITAIAGFALAVQVDTGLSWVLVASIPASIICIGPVVARMVPLFRTMQERIDTVNKVLREQIAGIRVVRAFVREPHEVKRFDAVNNDLTETSLSAGRLMAIAFPVCMLIVNSASVAVVWVGADRIAQGQMQVGALIAFLTYLSQILMAVMMATFMASMVPRAAVCAERIQEVLQTPTSVVVPPNPITEVTARGSLELRDVGFHYPGAEAPVLRGVSFRSLAGQTTAIIGSTGAGKTTLVNLIPRLFDVTSGEVLVDGVDVREIDPYTLTDRVGLVPQKPYLFGGTIASNLRFGKADATEEEMWAALEVAQAAGFVRDRPDGLDAQVEQGGTNLSGGQRQRLAIARALVRRPEIYLFDDSFSALDLATDARLRAALVPYVAGATVVIVAQRVSTIAGADQIIVLEDGEVVGIGTHDELLDTCPTYVEIAESQVAAEAAA